MQPFILSRQNTGQNNTFPLQANRDTEVAQRFRAIIIDLNPMHDRLVSRAEHGRKT